MTYDELKIKESEKYVKEPDRYIHTIEEVEIAYKLAVNYNLNINEIKIAALLHDYTKYESMLFHKENISPSDYKKYKNTPYILHAISASNILKEKFNIDNENIKTAIRYHVHGHVNMNLFTKVILISDKIEKNRNYPLVEKLRKLVYKDLDLTIILFLEDNIRYNISKGYEVSKE